MGKRRKAAKIRTSARKRLEDRACLAILRAWSRGEIAYIGGLEGPLIHGIRRGLILNGWMWRDANLAAKLVVESAQRRLRIERPSWYEGQCGYTDLPGARIERTRCAECGKPMPEDRLKFCSDTCRYTFNSRVTRRRNLTAEHVEKVAVGWT